MGDWLNKVPASDVANAESDGSTQSHTNVLADPNHLNNKGTFE